MKKLFLLLAILTIGIKGHSQTDSTFKMSKANCGTSPENMAKINNGSWAWSASDPNTPIGSFDPRAVDTCGVFRLFYEDWAFSEGFFDPSLGQDRRNTFCDVVNYVQTVLDMQNVISDGSFIDVHVYRSYCPGPSTFSAPPLYSALAMGGPFYPSNYSSSSSNTAGIFDGFAFDHITGGSDPNVTEFDCHVRMNFHQVWYGAGYTPVYYWNNDNITTTHCVYDLFSVLLHEITHGLGWISNINEDSNFLLKSANNNGSNNNNQFTLFDQTFLYYNHSSNNLSSTGNFDKLLTSGPAINSAVNSYTTPIRTNSIWLYDNDRPLNQPVYSGEYGGYFTSLSVGSLLSHMNEQLGSFTFTERISPGFAPHYVMGPFSYQGDQKRTWSFQEIRTLRQMGYAILISYANFNTIISNTPPTFSSGQFTEYVQTPANFGFPEGSMPNIIPMTNNSSGVSLTINLSSNTNLVDANPADQISGMTGTLYGIRGCSNGGNNTACLSWSNNNQTITYTPRTNFYGRAQFGFNLWDGHEKGAYVVYTIDVTPATGFTNIPSNELVLNGGYEEGTEVMQVGANESLPNSSFDFGIEGKFCTGIHLADSHPFEYLSYFTTPIAGGTVIYNSMSQCAYPLRNLAVTHPSDFGGRQTWPDAYLFPPATPSTTGSERFHSLDGTVSGSYFSLATNVVNCGSYTLEFDIAPNVSTNPLSGNFTFTLGFTNTPSLTPTFNFSQPVTVALATSSTWQHVVIPVFYGCGLPSSQYMRFFGPSVLAFIDNVSLRAATNPPLVVNAGSAQTICAGQSVNLSGSASPILCTATYTWTPGNLAGSAVSVSPTTTTTYTLTVNDGCRTSTGTVTITVHPLPVITFVPTNPFKCIGSPAVGITASGASTYSWTPATGLNQTTGASVTANPTVTTTYTVTGTSTFGCTSTATVTVTVYPLPTVTITPSTASFCIGSPAVGLTAGGANTYVWMPGNLSGSAITVSPTVTTTYTVVGTNNNGCTNTATATVTVYPIPNVSASANPASICIGDNSTLTASGATTYNWMPGNLSGSSVSVSPTITTTYTVTGTGAGGCTNTATVTVTVTQGCTGTLTINTPSALTTQTGISIAINADVVISSNTILSACDILILQNRRITVLPGCTLTVSASHLHACTLGSCTGMWYGIYVRTGGVLNINNNSIIEDAQNAVITEPITTSITGIPALNISQVIFNKNTVDIMVSQHPNSMSTNIIQNTLFTCRSLASTATTTTNFNNIKADIIAETNTYGAFGNTLAGVRTKQGVYLDNNNNANVGVPAASQMNYFENMDYGVFIKAATTTIKNNSFIRLQGLSALGIPYGVGVYAPTQTQGFYGTITVGANLTNHRNTFKDTYIGIEVHNQYDVFSEGNTFNTTNIVVTGSNQQGYTAINLSDISRAVSGTYNTITNFVTGIRFTRNSVTATLNPPFNFDNNTITNTLANTLPQNGILVSDILNNTITFAQPNSISTNSITKCNAVCIKVSNIKNKVTIDGNASLSVTYAATGNLYGVWLENCILAIVTNNQDIRSTFTNTYPPSQNLNIRGIYVTQSTNNLIRCNQIYQMGIGIEFVGTCTSPTAGGYGVYGNTFGPLRSGLRLTNISSTSGSIGQQGASGTPRNNIWQAAPAVYSDGQTYTTSSNAMLSVVYGLSASLPTYNLGTGTPYATGTSLQATTGTNYVCPCTNCHQTADGTETQQDSTAEQPNILTAGHFNLFPNPNDGNMTLEYDLNSKDDAELLITDITGNEVCKYKLAAVSHSVKIDCENMINGVYLYKIVSAGTIIKTGKISIIK